MRALGYRIPSPIDTPDALVALELPEPSPGPRELLVRVRAVSVNPVDVKLRGGALADGARVLGFDAAGVVEAVGAQVSLFNPGDDVYYAGTLNRPGTNAELHLVDERIVGKKPTLLSFAQAAALPLTSITAWELLFERLRVAQGPHTRGTLLVMGAAGGVGSVLVQLARRLTGLTVVATASRDETRAWCLELGAHHVIDHTKPLAGELTALGIEPPGLIAALNCTDQHWPALCEVLAPQGRIAVCDDPTSLDVMKLKRKSGSLHWEFMFTRPLFQTSDMLEQHRLLTEVARLVDDGVLRSTLTEHLGPLSVETLTQAHRRVESGRTRGKLVLDGFERETRS